MLIELPDSLIITDENSQESDDVIQMVNVLMSNVLNKHHEVHFGYDFLNWIIPKFVGLKKIYSILLHYKNNWSTNPIPKWITEYIKIIPDSRELTEIMGNRKIHHINFRRFLKGDPFSKSKLVCENNSDYAFYNYIGQWKQIIDNANYRIALAPFPGGGGTTEDMFNNSINDNLFTLCIIDSDKRYPLCDKVGDTAKNCRKCLKSAYPAYQYLYILSCMEAENLIPLEILKKLNYTGDIASRRDLLLNKLEQCNEKVLNKILPFFDLKDGYRKNPTFLSNDKWKNFAKECFEVIHKDKEFDSTMVKLADKQHFISGIKGDVLDKSIEWIKSNFNEFEKVKLLPFQLSEWTAIGQHIVNYGFAPSADSFN